MPNFIDRNGITIKDIAEITASILDGDGNTLGMRQIYGADINVDQDSADGQAVNIYALSAADIAQLCVQVYNSFDPDTALGRALDRLCAINGVRRQGAVYTQLVLVVTTDRAVTLNGAASSATPYTVTDGTGTRFVLTDTVAISSAGTHQLNFRSENPGAVQVQQNTITTPVTVVLGVVSVNNPYIPFSVGVNQQTDAALRLLRSRSVASPGQGFIDSMYAGLYNTPGVTAVKVYENLGDNPDADGIPGHSYWVVAEGGTDADVGRTVYLRRGGGPGQKGDITIPVLTSQGDVFPARFDRPELQDLWIGFSVAAKGGGSIDEQFLRSEMLKQLSFGIYESADTTSIISLVRSILDNAVVTGAGVSPDGSVFTEVLLPLTKRGKFVISAPHIVINGHTS